MNEALFSLEGRHALVTGGTRGIGKAVSLALARAGATVVANYVRAEAGADDLKRIAEAEGLAIRACRADITGDHGLERLIADLDATSPSLDVFVHCAATGVHRSFGELTLRHYDWTMALNVRAFFDLVHRLHPRFSNGGSILAVSSEGAMRAVPQYTLVGASKGALESMVRHMAVEFASRRIRVNALAPGSVRTDAWKAMPDAEDRLAAAIKRTPLGRLVTLEEVAAVALFLCVDASSAIVGQTIIVDGGARIVSP